MAEAEWIGRGTWLVDRRHHRSRIGVVTEVTEGESEMSYRRGCHDYTIGVASAFMWAAVVCGYGILWQQHIPARLYHGAVVGFAAFSLTGFAIVGIAYTNPVWFYELLEDGSGDRGA